MPHNSRSLNWFVSCAPAVAAGLLAVFSAGALRGADPAPAAEIVLRGSSPDEDADPSLLSPSAAFELRFASNMVGADQIGQAAAESPLVITPPLPGTFRWTSQRGGVFTPSEPPPLGTSYRVALRNDLKTADNQPVRVELARTFHTPALEVRGVAVASASGQEASPGPRMQVLFNSAVDPGQIARSLSFRNPAVGPPIPAIVKPVTDKDPFAFGTKVPQRTWRELFREAHAAPAAGPAVPAATAINRVIVTPASPLPPAKKSWVLVAAAGLNGIDPGASLPAAVEMFAADVKPFEVTKIEAVNDGAAARSLVVHFSKPLDKALTAENIALWLHVSPEAGNLKFELPQSSPFYETGGAVTITGDFATAQNYDVTVSAGLPSAHHFYELAADATKQLRFTAETPQIAFPDFVAEQLSAGRREFAFSARNAAKVRLRAKLVPPTKAAQALIAYNKVNNRNDEGYTDGHRLNFDQVPGEIVYDQEVAGSKDEDKPVTVTVRWDDILGARHNGVVLLEAEQPKPSPGQKKRSGAQTLVQVTDLGVVWKSAPGGEVLTYVFSMADATPVQARLRLLDAAGQPLSGSPGPAAATRADGVAILPPAADQAVWLSVEAGDDCHVLPFARGRRSTLGLYQFHLPATAYPQDDADTAANADVDDPDAAPATAKTGPKPPHREVLLFSDRGVYKPGEEAHVKAIVREWRHGGLADAPAGAPATLRAFDAKGRRFWQKDTFLSAASTLSETIPLPTATLGHYRVEISFDGKKAADADAQEDADDASSGDSDDDDDSDAVTPNVCRFLVQDYQPNAFEVKLAKPASPPIGAGQVPVMLTAHYYMGKVLSHAKAVWSLKANDTLFEPDGFDDYTFGSNDLDGRFNRSPGELALDGQGALSAGGELTLTPQIVLNNASPAPRRVHLQAGVTDQDQQTVAANASFTVHSSDFYLGVRALPEIVRAGDPVPVEVVAVRAADAQPVPEPVKVTAKLSRIEQRTNRIANDAGESDYDPHVDLVPVGTMELTSTGVRRIGKLWEPEAEADTLLAATGQNPGAGKIAVAVPVAPGEDAALVPKEPGEYVVEVSAQDAAGRPVRSAVTFEVLGDKEAEWGYRNASQLPLICDKAEYHAGQQATLLVETPISGRALVTVEREGVLRSFVTGIAKEHPAIQVPILPGDAPNVYVSVLLLRGSDQSPRRIKQPEYRAGYCQLLVPKTDTRLAVDVHPARSEYQPGEEVNVAVTVNNEDKQPAAGAEVTLYAVDKGVLSLTGYRLPEPAKTFYHPRALDVQTGLTLPDLFSEDPADLEFTGDKGYAANKGYLIGGGGEDGRGDRLRENFVACAYWNASLVTDAQGQVSAHFPAPDGLTEYEVMAVVNEGGLAGQDEHAAGRFGGGQGEFRINKPLMLEPGLPQFGNVGDHLLLRAVVHNQSPVAGEASITLDLDDKASTEPDTEAARTRHVRLAAGESKAVDIPVVFTHTGQANWTWHARLVGEGTPATSWRDAVRSTLLVGSPTPLRTEIAASRVDDGHAADLLASINPELLEGEDGVIQVSISTTRLSELGDGVDALLHYPYGCVEQTTSSLLPWLALKGFQDVLPQLRHTPAQVDDTVARGIDKLIGMQTESGGLAYWPGATGRAPHPWGSAYGGLGLALAKRAGYYVPAANFNKLCTYLSQQLRSNEQAAHDTYHEHSETDRCLALYALALAGKGEPAYYEQFFNRRNELSPEDRTLLALAITESKGAPEMIRALLQPGPRDKEQPDGWNEFASTSVLDGMRLAAWCHFQPQDPVVEERMTRLLDDRTGRDGTWDTTQGDAWAVLAMAAYAHEVEKPAAAASGVVVLGGVSKPFALQDKAGTFTCEFPLDAAAGGKDKLSLTESTPGYLYVQTKVASRPRGGATLLARPTNGKGGYVISRRYDKLLDNGTRASAENLRVGDRVLVSLEIEAPDRASYVAVDDPLPAVLEAVNPEFKTGGAGGNAPEGGGNWWVSDFRELRADRAVFFCDTLYAGHFHLQYLARVRAAGTATAPAAKIEEMYHPDHYAETAATSLSSKALE